MEASTSSNRPIHVRKGDLTKEQTDVIVVCSSSIGLLASVLQAGGDTVMSSYNIELRKNSTQIIAVAASGQLLAKAIYFVSWEPNSDEILLCKSLEKLVSDVIKKATNEKYKSIAFPAIGCGQFGCSINLVTKTLIGKVHQLRTFHSMTVSFIIQPDRTDIYNEFQKQIDLLEPFEQLEPLERTPEIPTVSVPIKNGMIIVEKGNITTQKVDAIIGNSSSIALQDTIIKAAGDEVETAWEPDADDSILRQSIIDFIWNIIQNVISCNYTSIACPAIGCGGYGCSVDIVVKTIVQEIKNQLKTRNLALTVKFVIRPEQQNIYDEFCKQVLASEEERIQNERWLLQYLAHSRDFKKRLTIDTEKRLYHGCPKKAAELIIEDCFNRSFAGVNGTAYGVGVYFSSNPVYSHRYTQPSANGERCIVQ
ncbi:unnamed protein product [Rotaria sordida]|uniref:Poly [ADP-ribose] polymerase n=1 Tax=Rotaria sordida TaxID=392033 RepID=A0A819L0K6_9BILA|nr:unnamed protein product [Rotaria sordida]